MQVEKVAGEAQVQVEKVGAVVEVLVEEEIGR